MTHPIPPHDQAGFTLIEILLVMAVLAILAGTVVPLAGAARDAERSLAVELELELLADALERHYADHARFPDRLDDLAFVRGYLSATVDCRLLNDDWADGALYGYRIGRSPDRAQLHSVGADGRDRGFRREELRIEVYGGTTGNLRTRERMRVVGAALERWARSSSAPALTGDWQNDAVVLGLGSALTRDGFGTPLRIDPDLLSLRSAGADRRFGTTDDLEL